MKKKQCIFLLLASASTLFFTLCSTALAADKVVVVPLHSRATTSCTAPDEIVSAGHCWKDRDLGAQRAATYSDQWQAYGGLYQWGRPRDGHQHRFNTVHSTTRSQYDDPQHSEFITTSVYPYDWRNPQNDNLWQGLGGTNNPCPQGFRVPTATELADEVASWETEDIAGAFASLQLVASGYRSRTDGLRHNEGVNGYYWTSTVAGVNARRLYISSSSASFDSLTRSNGYSIRCLKD